MSRDDGFAVMDVSTGIVNDPKVRRLYRDFPEHADRAFVLYAATMAESWKDGRRVTIEDAWPAFIPPCPEASRALADVGLIDPRGMVTTRAWKGWFGPADDRRRKSRAKSKRANDRRHAEAMGYTGSTPVLHPAHTGATPAPVPSVPTEPTVPPEGSTTTSISDVEHRRPIALVNPGRTS